MTTEIPAIVQVWKLGGGSGKVSATNNYKNNHGANLFCTANNKYLTWKKMPVGINLDFITDASVKKCISNCRAARSVPSFPASSLLSASAAAKPI